MGKIVGDVVGIPNPQPDWNQTDPLKADYIKNKPDLNKKQDKTVLLSKIQKVENGSMVTDIIPVDSEIKVTITGLPKLEDDDRYYIEYGFINKGSEPFDAYSLIPDDEGNVTISLPVTSRLTNGADFAEMAWFYVGSNYLSVINLTEPLTVEYTCYQDVSDAISRHDAKLNDIDQALVSSLSKDDVDSLQYYGDLSIKPTNAECFLFGTDDDTMTATVYASEDNYNLIQAVEHLVIPHHYVENGKIYTVTKIGNSTFMNLYFKSVIIPNTIVEIEEWAFDLAYGFEKIELPNSIITLKTGALAENSLTEVIFPKSLKSIERSVFAYTNLKNAILNDGLTSIDSEAFGDCLKLENIVIPVSVENVGRDLFYIHDADSYEELPWINVFYNGTKKQWEDLLTASGIKSTEEAFGNDQAEVFFLGVDVDSKADEVVTLIKSQVVKNCSTVIADIPVGETITFKASGFEPGQTTCDADWYFNDSWVDAMGLPVADENGNIVLTIQNKEEYSIGDASSFRIEISKHDEDLGYSVSAVDSFVVEYNIHKTVSDTVKTVFQSPKHEISTYLKSNQKYNLGEMKELNLKFPTVAEDGDVIYLTFTSGETPTNLSIDITNTCDIDIVPEANTGYEIFGMHNGLIWIINYSEYTVSEV